MAKRRRERKSGERKRAGRVTKARPAPVPYRPLAGAQDAEARRAALLWIGGVWLASRVVLTAVGLFARATLGLATEGCGIDSGHAWLNIWGAWDSAWYYGIAEDGYDSEPRADGYANYNFFPLYPWLARLIGWPLGEGGSYVGGLLLSNFALLAGAWMLYRWLELEKDRDTAKKAVLFMFLFPTAYVFSALMTEALFIALSIGAYYFARRGNWMLAGALGGLSAMTRSLGLFIAPLLAWEYLRQQYWRTTSAPPSFSLQAARRLLMALDFRILWLGLVPAGLGVFIVVCWQVTGDPLAFVTIQKDAWTHGGEQGVNPLAVLARSFDYLSTVATNVDERVALFGLDRRIIGIIYGALLSIAVFALLLAGCKKIGAPLTLWSMAMVLLPLSSAYRSTYSMPRYLAVIFPLFVIFAALKWRGFLWAVAIALALLQLLTWSLWTVCIGVAI